MNVINLLLKRVALSLCFVGLLSFTAYGQIEYSAGHGDIGLEFLGGGELEPHWHFENEDDDTVLDGELQVGQPDEEYEADEVYARVPDASFGPAPAFSGAANAYILPETNVVGLPFLGLATEELDAVTWPNPIDVSFSVSGPGEYSMWTVPTLSPPAQEVSTFNGDLSLQIAAEDHFHFNWGFTEPGLYEVTISASTTDNLGTAASGSGTFLFAVGDNTVVPEPGALALVGLAFSGLGLVRRKLA